MNFSLEATPSRIIGIGFLVAGIGQLTFVFLPAFAISGTDLGALAVWQSATLGVGLALASPLNNYIFSSLAGRAPEDKYNQVRNRLVGNLQFISMFILISLVLVIWLGYSNALSDGHWFLSSLFVSLLLQVFLAIQRAEYSAAEKWWGLSCQLIVDGICRIILITLAIRFGHDSLMELIAIGVLSQVLSLLIPRLAFGGQLRIMRLHRETLSVTFIRMLPLWVAAGAGQFILSLPPSTAQLIGNVSALEVAALGGIMQLARIPASFSAPFTLPSSAKIAQDIRKTRGAKVTSIFLETIFRLARLWMVAAIVVFSISYLSLDKQIAYSELLQPSVYLVAILMFVSIWYPFYLETLLLIYADFKGVALSWTLSILIIAIILRVVGSSVTGSLISVLAGILLASTCMTLRFYKIVKTTLKTE